MEDLGAAATAVILAFSSNRLFLSRLGPVAILWAVPAWEEFVKTGCAYLWRASLPGTHGLFGLAEWAWDARRKGSRGALAGLCALATHLAFGFATTWAARATGSLALGFLFAALLHALWNTASALYEGR